MPNGILVHAESVHSFPVQEFQFFMYGQDSRRNHLEVFQQVLITSDSSEVMGCPREGLARAEVAMS